MTSTNAVARPHFLKSLDLQSVLQPELGGGQSGIKVVATIGPACHSVDQLGELLEAGTVGARFDLTWGPLDFHRASLANLQTAMALKQRLCCTMVDTLGRELMIRRQIKMDDQGWPVHEESFAVQAGQEVIVTTRMDAVASGNVLPITYERFTEMAEPGDTIYVGRYLVCGADSASLYLEVVSVVGPDVFCVAKNNAVLEGLLTVYHVERSTNALVNVQNTLPLLSQYDKEAIEALSREFEIDFISLSYTRSEEDVHEARAWLSSLGLRNTRVLAKLETRQSLFNLDGILSAADGVIISRGNLGLDCPPEKMAMIQKFVIEACNMAGKPVLITRVVDTMVENPRPTRAEATDVANAVLDGVDGILLGAETLRGRFPADTVRTISRICHSAEKVFDHTSHFDQLMERALVEEEERAVIAAKGLPPANVLHPEAWGSLQGLSSAAGGPTFSTSGAAATPPPLAPPHAAGNGHHDHHVSITDALLRVSPSASTTDVTQAPHAGLHGRSPLSMSTTGLLARGAGSGAAGNGLPPRNSLGARPSHLHAMTKVATEVALSGAAVSAVAAAGGADPRGASTANMASLPHIASRAVGGYGPWRSPYLSKMESIASSAVRVADKIQASLMLVYTHSGATAALVAKYRPPMPILTLVVPQLVSDGLKWKLEGRAHARHCLLTRSLLPMLANPSAEGEENLNYAVEYAASLGIVKPHDNIVCVQRAQNDICIKVVSVDQLGCGIKRMVKSSTLVRRTTLPPANNFYSDQPFASTPSIAPGMLPPGGGFARGGSGGGGYPRSLVPAPSERLAPPERAGSLYSP